MMPEIGTQRHLRLVSALNDATDTVWARATFS
jgi:hypothetical protein